jgi:hypothetical protein
MAHPAGISGGVATRTRWVGVGRSGETDAHLAGAAAAAAALDQGDGRLLIVFSSNRYDLNALLAGINERSGGVPLIGCSTAGEIAGDGPGEAGVVVTALGGEGFEVTTAAAEHVSERVREAGAEVAAAAMPPNGAADGRVLMLLTDPLAGNQQELVRGAYGVVGAGVPLVGGAAGDDLKMNRTHQLHGDRVLTDAVVGASISSDGAFGIGIRHGWRRVGDAMVVTRSADNSVLELDGRPALDVYLERLEAPPEARRDPEAFTAFALAHPLGLSRRSGPDQIRCIGKAGFEDRSIGCVAEVPQGGLSWFMEGDTSTMLSAADSACADALASLDGRPPLGLLAFDCTGRRRLLGDDGVEAEVERLAASVQGAPVAGFYTYGEIARTHGVSGFHNQTLVVLALG